MGGYANRNRLVIQLCGMQERGVLASPDPGQATARVDISGVGGGQVLPLTACELRNYGQ